MNLIKIAKTIPEEVIIQLKDFYDLNSFLSRREKFLINLSFKGSGYDSFYHFQALNNEKSDNAYLNPANVSLKDRVSLTNFIFGKGNLKRATLRFFYSGFSDWLLKGRSWEELDEKLTFHLLKKHYIDNFDGDRERVDNHIFYLKYLALNQPKNLIYIEYLENGLKNKILESGSENTISFKQHEQFQILNSKKLIKILEVLQEIKVINDWKKVYHQFSYPNGEIQEWGYEEYFELNFFIRFLEIHEIVKAPSFRNRAIQFVFKLKNGEIIDPDHLKKERQRRGISKLTRSNFKDFLLKENNNELINLANAIKNAVEEVDD